MTRLKLKWAKAFFCFVFFLASETNPRRECELAAQRVVLMNTLFADSALVLARPHIKESAAACIYVFTSSMCFQAGSGVRAVVAPMLR